MSRMLTRGTLRFADDAKEFRTQKLTVRNDRTNPQAWAALAVGAVKNGKRDLAKKCIKRAVNLAPADAAVLADVFDACRHAGWLNLAKRLIICGRFRAPHDRALVALWNRCRYEITARDQRRKLTLNIPSVLPFLRAI